MNRLPSYTEAEIEEKAEQFLQHHGLYDNRMLMIEHVIEQYGYAIIPVPGLAELAEAYIPIQQGIIFIDEDQYSDVHSLRYRFTLAEELAHILLHRPFFDGKTEAEISALQTKISDRGYLEIEREAKFMASCILMRASVLMERFHHFYSAQSERSNNESVILNFVIRQLGRDFCVSRPAISLRCSSLELIDKAELDNMLLN